MIIGFIFVSILGTLWHFVYEWSGNNALLGLIAPVNESVFEHMKLIFFPALFYLPITKYYLKKDYPSIVNAMSYGILAGTLFLPAFFYLYTGILGTNYMFIDIASFYIGTLITFFITYVLTKNGKQVSSWGRYLLIVMLFIFVSSPATPL